MALKRGAARTLIKYLLPVLLAFLLGASLRGLDFDKDTNTDWAELPPWPVFRAGFALGDWVLSRLPTLVLPPNARVVGLSTAFIHSQALYCAAKLGLADALATGPLAAGELARAKGVKEDHLRRVLRLLVAAGVFREPRPGVYANNRASGVLRRDHPSSVLDIVLHMVDESYLGHSKMYEAMFVDHPHTAFAAASGGLDLWQWYDHTPEAGARFDRAMVALSAAENLALETDYDWAQHANQTVLDIGGGVGGVLSFLLQQHPGMRGILFDRPPVIERARALWSERHPQLASRVELVGGDFFSTVPQADVYWMQQILHDWSDEDSIKILQTVRRAIGGDTRARLLIHEIVMSDSNPTLIKATVDLQMMSMVGGKERTEGEWRALLEAGGFELERVVRLRSLHDLVVARPRA